MYKFGGASVKDAAAILNVCRIVSDTRQNKPLLIVVSAMGKTTNALEEIFELAFRGNDYSAQLATLATYHYHTARELGQALAGNWHETDLSKPESEIERIIGELSASLEFISSSSSYDENYDRIIGFGEEMAACLLYSALASTQSDVAEMHWRGSMVVTDATWREGKVDWELTKKKVDEEVRQPMYSGSAEIIVTEGFTGRTRQGSRTTLGREGSDYSAAIFAYCLNAESVTIWKDVAGLLNADPKVFADTVRYPEISYRETIEMAYYGASVIHPKTLKPLAERGIPLYVRSFLDPSAPGTVIHDCQHPPLAPAFIRKTGQCLISFESKDFAFISEENLASYFWGFGTGAN